MELIGETENKTAMSVVAIMEHDSVIKLVPKRGNSEEEALTKISLSLIRRQQSEMRLSEVYREMYGANSNHENVFMS
jgi:hypothetical protein